MRSLLPVLAALLIAGCATSPTTTSPEPDRPEPARPSDALVGLTAGELVHRFGTPALQVREGPGLKLQFRGRACVLDAFLYPVAGSSGAERVTFVEARTATGAATDTTACAAALRRA